MGSMNEHLKYIEDNFNIKISTFHEPDLGDQLTSIVFIIYERIFNRDKYPDFDESIHVYEQWVKQFGEENNLNEIIQLREFLHPKNFRLA